MKNEEERRKHGRSPVLGTRLSHGPHPRNTGVPGDVAPPDGAAHHYARRSETTKRRATRSDNLCAECFGFCRATARSRSRQQDAAVRRSLPSSEATSSLCASFRCARVLELLRSHRRTARAAGVVVAGPVLSKAPHPRQPLARTPYANSGDAGPSRDELRRTVTAPRARHDWADVPRPTTSSTKDPLPRRTLDTTARKSSTSAWRTQEYEQE